MNASSQKTTLFWIYLEEVQLNASSSTFRALYISGRDFYGLDGVWQMH